jgi:endoglucanase
MLRGVRAVSVGFVVAALLLLSGSAAQAGVANAGLSVNPDPLAGLAWGNYSGSQDEVFPAYRRAHGARRRLLGAIALKPRARWFGPWYADGQIETTLRQYIANATRGNPNVMAQLAVFRLKPWESAACHSLPTGNEQASYKRWIRNAAAGIGSSRVALILQPDLPFALCAPHHSNLPLQLVAYAAQTFSALPHTDVYIDAGAADWPTLNEAVSLLRQAGVASARGFALDATHYDSTARQIRFGRNIAQRLAAAGIPNRHFVINTAQNGHPFKYHQYHGRDYANAPVCHRHESKSKACVALGIPPTWQVSEARWRLSSGVRALAARYVDAYLWFGRPWLENQSDPFLPKRAIALARSNPF